MSASERIEALLGSEPVRAARRALGGGDGAWLVGGVVRDALDGRSVGDVDIALAGDPRAAARAIARAVRGPCFELSGEFGAWRALDRSADITFDVTRLQGETIAQDLAARDFSVNAMALPLSGGALLDPAGGAADLERRVLRVLGPRSYEADPLRALRLVRLATELGLRPDAATLELTARAAPRLAEPARERVWAELRRVLAAPAVVTGVELADATGVLAAVLPELEQLKGVHQSRFHHRDVFGHTLEVLARLVELQEAPEAVFGELAPRLGAVLAQPLGDGIARGDGLRLAALLHDITGHDSEGERVAAGILRRLRAAESVTAFVARLVREHLVLGFMVHDLPPAPAAVHGYLRRTEPVEVEVTLLSCADRMATRGEGQEPWIDAHLGLARELMTAALDWREHGPPRPLLRGDELAAELGIAPGPRLGELLAALERAAYAGEVSTRGDALALARALRDDPPR